MTIDMMSDSPPFDYLGEYYKAVSGKDIPDWETVVILGPPIALLRVMGHKEAPSLWYKVVHCIKEQPDSPSKILMSISSSALVRIHDELLNNYEETSLSSCIIDFQMAAILISSLYMEFKLTVPPEVSARLHRLNELLEMAPRSIQDYAEVVAWRDTIDIPKMLIYPCVEYITPRVFDLLDIDSQIFRHRICRQMRKLKVAKAIKAPPKGLMDMNFMDHSIISPWGELFVSFRLTDKWQVLITIVTPDRQAPTSVQWAGKSAIAVEPSERGGHTFVFDVNDNRKNLVNMICFSLVIVSLDAQRHIELLLEGRVPM